MMTTNPATDPTLRISLEVDNDSPLPLLLEGRTIAVLGAPLDNHTAEARLPNQSLQIHSQLVLARRLRASLEHAASMAESLPTNSPSSHLEAMGILQSSIPEIHQLVRLTEALKGGYTLDDEGGAVGSGYNEWTSWANEQKEKREAQLKRDERVIRRQFRELRREQNPNLEVDEELEKQHDALISKPRKEGVEGADGAEEFGGHGTVGDGPILESENPLQAPEIETPLSRRSSKHDESSGLEGDGDSDEDFQPAKKRSWSKGNKQPRQKPTSTSSAKPVARPTEKSSAPPAPTAPPAPKAQKSAVAQDSTSTAKGQKTANSPVIDSPAAETPTTTSPKPQEPTKRMSTSSAGSDKRPAKKTKSQQPEFKPDTVSSYTVVQFPKKVAPPKSAERKRAKAKRFVPDEVTSTSIPEMASTPSPAPKSAKSTTSSDTKPSPSTSVQRSKSAKPRPLKKCHDCKVKTTRYRHCNYWNISGTKCGKAFCTICLSAKYTLGDDVLEAKSAKGCTDAADGNREAASGSSKGIPIEEIIMCPHLDAEWHCPSCLGTCTCATCVLKRKKDQEREKSRLEAMSGDNVRKSSRRSAARSSFSHFHM